MPARCGLWNPGWCDLRIARLSASEWDNRTARTDIAIGATPGACREERSSTVVLGHEGHTADGPGEVAGRDHGEVLVAVIAA